MQMRVGRVAEPKMRKPFERQRGPTGNWKQDDNQHGSCDRRTLRNPAFGYDTKFDLRVEVRLSLLWAPLLASPRETDSVGWRELLPFMPFAEACSQNVDKIELHQP